MPKTFNPNQPIVMCAMYSIVQRLRPGHKLGYSCVFCGKALQVSPSSLDQLAKGANPLCNPCGTEALHLLSASVAADPSKHLTIQFQPDATKAVEEVTGQCALDVFPNAEVRFTK